MSNYDPKFVAFIDILGFSDLVKRSEKDDKLFIKGTSKNTHHSTVIG